MANGRIVMNKMSAPDAKKWKLCHGVGILISDGKLRFQTIKSPQPLTFRFIKECLSECLSRSEEVDQIIHYIKNKRDIQYKKDIRRIYTKKD